MSKNIKRQLHCRFHSAGDFLYQSFLVCTHSLGTQTGIPVSEALCLCHCKSANGAVFLCKDINSEYIQKNYRLKVISLSLRVLVLLD